MTTERLDLATSLAVVPDVTPDANNGAVCAILRYAKRTRGGRLLVDELCEALGLNLAEALAEKRPSEPPTRRARPDPSVSRFRSAANQSAAGWCHRREAAHRNSPSAWATPGRGNYERDR